jgi:hypothetical protein
MRTLQQNLRQIDNYREQSSEINRLSSSPPPFDAGFTTVPRRSVIYLDGSVAPAHLLASRFAPTGSLDAEVAAPTKRRRRSQKYPGIPTVNGAARQGAMPALLPKADIACSAKGLGCSQLNEVKANGWWSGGYTIVC